MDCHDICTVHLDTVARLGSESDSIWPNPFVSAVRDKNGNFFVGGTDHPGQFIIYAPDGSLKRTFGRSGKGPGEYSAYLARWFRTPSDSIVVVDTDANRLAVLDTDGTALRTVNVPHRLNDILWLDGRILLQADIATPARVGYVIHEWSGDSLGSPHIEINPYRGEFDGSRKVAASDDRTFWMAQRGAYIIDLYNQNFEIIKTLKPTVRWFSESDGIPKSSEPPASSISGMWQESDSVLWVIVAVADKNWQPWKNEDVTIKSINEKRDWVLEALDPISGRRIGSRYFANAIFFGRGDGMLYEKTEGEHGQPMLVAYKPHFSLREDHR